jgi:uncharacterized protein with HEPN domain
MPRDYKVYLEDVRDAVEKIRNYTAGYSFESFAKDSKTFDAVVRNLEVIGEAIKNVPPTIRDAHPAVDWHKITGLRDILIHEYFGVDREIIWDVIQNKLPELERQVRQLLAE